MILLSLVFQLQYILFIYLFIYLFTAHIILNGRMLLNNKLVYLWKEAIVPYFMLQSENLPVGTNKNYKKSHARYSVFQ